MVVYVKRPDSVGIVTKLGADSTSHELLDQAEARHIVDETDSEIV